MTDLASWLLAQIADDEAAARATTGGGGPWEWRDGEPHSLVHWWRPDMHPMNVLKCTEDWPPTDGDAAHIARHDPARVLAECAAKRRIVELCATWTDQGDRVDADVAFKTQAITAKTLLRLLAQPYADRPGFDPAWKVET